MKILQVKEYHEQIASDKHHKAIERWKEKENGYSYPVKTMFYFMITDKRGDIIKERENGYVAFDETSARFDLNRETLTA